MKIRISGEVAIPRILGKAKAIIINFVYWSFSSSEGLLKGKQNRAIFFDLNLYNSDYSTMAVSITNWKLEWTNDKVKQKTKTKLKRPELDQ